MASFSTGNVSASPLSTGYMLQVSLLVEFLRARPALLFWVATFAQTSLWTLVPALLYGAPPGEVPLVLAAGHEWVAGSRLGPPLANWLAEVVFDVFGHRMIGIYLLSQVCVAVSFWAVFVLGRAIVGKQHAAMAVLLMTGIVAFSVPTPEFGPAILAMPLTALALLHYWRAMGQDRRRYWLALGLELGLLLLTTYTGLITVGLMLLFAVSTARGRASLAAVEPWVGGMIAVLIVFPHLIWIDRTHAAVLPALHLVFAHLADWAHLAGWLVAFHLGAFVLLVVASGWPVARRQPAPVFERAPVPAFARKFVYCFALAPPLAGTLASELLGISVPAGGSGALVLLSGLALVVAAGDAIRLYGQRILGQVWTAILLAPALAVVAAVVLLPWTLAVALSVDRPAHAMGQFFTDTFRHRTTAPFRIVAGDAQIAGLIALASPDRPSLLLLDNPDLTPWVNDGDLREKGAIVVWPLVDNTGAPPPAIKSRFPDLVPEVPHSFERPVQGRLPVYRVGWAMIRPRSASQPLPAPVPTQ